jgi:hypothetical protein
LPSVPDPRGRGRDDEVSADLKIQRRRIERQVVQVWAVDVDAVDGTDVVPARLVLLLLQPSGRCLVDAEELRSLSYSCLA